MAHEIKCPQCGTVFQVDEGDYAQIVAQVRTAEFQHDIEEHEKLLAHEREQAVAKTRADMQQTIVQTRESLQQAIAEREAEIARLSAQLAASTREFEAAKQLAVTQATSELEKQRDSLSAQMQQVQQAHAVELENIRGQYAAQLAREQEAHRVDVEREQTARRTQAENAEAQHRAQLMEREAEQEKALSALRAKNDQLVIRAREELASRDAMLKYKDEEIERLKDMKARLSTKMVGESLEQHCLTEFNRIRATAFPNAVFGKDNDASEGTKGDFIYRETDEDGNEIISIMFEMKNESDDSVNRHKNEDFLKKLDHDRKQKNCEYAILVTLLEPENELYNDGIVDVSYLYPKMYVIRPQFFIPLIGVLRNAALNSMGYKRELATMRQQNIDVTHFEEKLEQFKDGFGKNFMTASKKFNTAIEEIDKTITHLQKVRENLVSSEHQLSLANKKAENLTVRKLTYGNATMQERFKEARERNGEESEE